MIGSLFLFSGSSSSDLLKDESAISISSFLHFTPHFEHFSVLGA